ncbi:hypothetical protein [Sulfuricurvum sp.]|uniref:hypothetical protein n=1 Tax=Sulfuricurvum sp. TaxID=2025608 RepID=UPI003567A260
MSNDLTTAAAIAIQFRGDSGYVTRQFAARERLVCDPISIGSSANGTTSTRVIVDGID